MRIIFVINLDDLEKLDAISAKRGYASRSCMIREAISDYVKRYQEPSSGATA